MTDVKEICCLQLSLRMALGAKINKLENNNKQLLADNQFMAKPGLSFDMLPGTNIWFINTL